MHQYSFFYVSNLSMYLTFLMVLQSYCIHMFLAPKMNYDLVLTINDML